jgi:hypothetical protein
MKIRAAGVELFHTERRTDGRTNITKLMVPFCNFENASKKTLDIFPCHVLFQKVHKSYMCLPNCCLFLSIRNFEF